MAEKLKDVRLLYCCGWYDGPLTGLAEHDGAVSYFHGEPFTPGWTLYRLQPDEQQQELTAKAEFETEVGTHWSFDIPAAERQQRDRDRQAAYFDKYSLEERQERHRLFVNPDRQLGVFYSWTPTLKR